jgi:hypothetical protein
MRTEMQCVHLAYGESKSAWERFKHYLISPRIAVKICNHCGCVLKLSKKQLLILYATWMIIGIGKAMLIRMQRSNFAVATIILILTFPCALLAYAFTLSFFDWEETSYNENTLPWYVKTYYIFRPVFVGTCSILTVYPIARFILGS